ncbi:sulfatase family protein [Aestuariibaculum suncheonense]|uniref:Sulfatase n=1 Tax=Aestuariibaculum suncheonense TaxID=1028745 RepID=A0A8J6Q9H9_9FLAO|nr:sulfatase [Aestuariibaculum suncheonense]MBD0835675.1 sulfatase [Aestuariibaculum suncheonense]
MKSLVFFKLSLTLCLVIGVTSCNSNVKQVNQKKPNLLFIFPDQLRNAALGINRQDPVYTPHIDQLAKEGLVITNAISNYPLCSPYRGMLMTGKLPYNNTVLSNSNSNRFKYNNSWQKEDVSFSDVLVQNGYDAGYVGKLHLTSPPPIAGKDSVIWDAYTPKAYRHGFNFWYSYGTFDVHNTPHYWVNDAKEEELTYVNEWSPKHEADVIIDYLKNPSEKTRSKGKPFALFWSVNPPHPPYQYVPEQYAEMYEDKSLDELLVRKNVNLETQANSLAFHKGATRNRTNLAKDHVRDYFAMITGVDEQIGRVLQTLKDQGLDKNTIVVITSDHGEMMGSHGLMSKNIWYEESINIPFIIRWPEKIKAHQTSNLIVSATDVMPTLLNLLQATDGLPKDLDGEDLSALFLGKNEEEPTSALYYYIEEGRPESGHRGIRTKRYTYVITLDNGDTERRVLFDNVEDPFQEHNIAGENLEVENELHQQLLNQLKIKNDPWLSRYLKLTEINE